MNALEYKKIGFTPLTREGIVLISKDEIEKCLTTLHSLGLRILGIDSFMVNHNTIQPFVEFSPDWSYEKPKLEILLTFASSLPSEITHVEIVLDESAIERV